MKSKIKKIVGFISAVALICIFNVVNASTVKVSLESDSELKAGSVVEVTLKVTNIDTKIDAITGTLEYDKNVFEEVAEDNFEGLNKWNFQIYNMDNGQFIYAKSSPISENGEIAKVSLKVKDTISVNSTIIKMKDLSTSDMNANPQVDLAIPETSIELKTKEQNKENTISNEITNTTINEIANTVTNEVANRENNVVVNKVVFNNKVTNENASSGKLPQTGENYIIIVALAAIIVVAIIIYKKYRELNIK